MWKSIGLVAVSAFLVYEAAGIGYSALILSFAMPLEQRCERNVTRAVLELKRGIDAAGTQLPDATKVCETSASMVGALVMPGFKP
nr:hypothetical protein HUO10_005304 [Paraburkholderia busanensis]